MNILSIVSGMHSCGWSYIKNGKIEFSYEDERFSRIKPYIDYENNFHRFPKDSLWWIIEKNLVNFDEVDYITSYYDKDFVEKAWNNLKSTFPKIGEFPSEKYIKVNHHTAHCTLAYYCSGFEDDTLVLSVDGAGEKNWSKGFLGLGGNMKQIKNNLLDTKSLGHFYCMLTELLGFKRLKDEGKIVGLSSHGKYVKWIYDAFNECVTVDSNGNTDADYSFESRIYSQKIYNDFYQIFIDKNPDLSLGPHNYSKEDLAYNGQLVFEEKILQLINYYHKQYPNIRNLALAGGVFANVKLNKKINELDWVEEVFIAPPMGDEGLAVGCGLAVHKHFNPDFKPFKLKDVFMGAGFSDDEFEYDKEKFIERPYNKEEIAYDLRDGKVIGWFQGKSEHGPRALCNRSIIADPSVPGTYKKVNDRLQRNDNMPFAPVVIDKFADKVFNVTKSKYTAEFMTMLYDTNPEWYDKIPAVVHPIDKTARIQIVTENSNNKFYKLINEFNKATNIPVLLNTSFNVHGEPIVCHPQEAFVHLDNGIVDKLIVNNKTYYKK